MKTKLWLPFQVTLLLTLVHLETFSQSAIKGTIIEKSSGETIIGAAILEKGTSNGCVTDYNGKFTLNQITVIQSQSLFGLLALTRRN